MHGLVPLFISLCHFPTLYFKLGTLWTGVQPKHRTATRLASCAVHSVKRSTGTQEDSKKEQRVDATPGVLRRVMGHWTVTLPSCDRTVVLDEKQYLGNRYKQR